MDVETIYSIGGAATNISYVLILLLMMFSGAYKKYRAFTIFIFLMALWGYADYLMGQTEEYIGIWRAYNFCNIFNAFLFYVFAQEFTKKYNLKYILASGIICCIFLFLNYYNNLLIPDAVMELTGVELMKAIPFYNMFVLYYCVMLVLGTLWIYRNYHHDIAIKRMILLACMATIIGDAYSFGTVYFESLYDQPYLAYLICFLPYSITYLTLKHRLFDARSSLLHLFRWIFIFGSGLILVGTLGWGMQVYFQREIIFNIDLIVLFALFIIFTTILTKSHWVRTRFQISDLVKLEKSVQEFLSSSSVYTSHEELLKNILETLQAGLKISSVQLIGGEDLQKVPEIVKVFSAKNKAPASLSFKEEQNNTLPSAYFKELEKLGELCIAIHINKKLSHILVLPEKNSQSPYTTSEKNAIFTIRSKIALSLQILQYNKQLQDEVERQTKTISEQGKELEISYKKLEALDQEKDVFMNMAAHELRTPMTIIHGYADIMLDPSSGELNQMQKKLVENILKGSDSLIALVNDLLDLSRIDAGKMKLVYAPCNIKSLSKEIFENFKELMGKKNIEFTFDELLNPEQVLVIDQAKLVLIFNNLMSNAYKYTPDEGKATFAIKTITKDGSPWLHFSVQDTGIGIPEAEIPNVFNRFATISTHNNIKSTIQSTGLGLSIVKKIVTGMKGTIGVTSVVDHGTTFTVEIPYNPETTQEEK